LLRRDINLCKKNKVWHKLHDFPNLLERTLSPYVLSRFRKQVHVLTWLAIEMRECILEAWFSQQWDHDFLERVIHLFSSIYHERSLNLSLVVEWFNKHPLLAGYRRSLRRFHSHTTSPIFLATPLRTQAISSRSNLKQGPH